MSSAFTHAVVLDFEATCDDRSPPRPQEIIEFPSVLLSLATFESLDEFTAFVRPVHHPVLTGFCRGLTSIRQADIDAAGGFAEVFEAHHGWLDGHRLNESNAIIVTCGDWDLRIMLPAQFAVAEPPIRRVAPIYRRWHNIKRSFCAATGRNKAPGMDGMLRALDLPLIGHHHRGIDDCRNIAAICAALHARGAALDVTGAL